MRNCLGCRYLKTEDAGKGYENIICIKPCFAGYQKRVLEHRQAGRAGFGAVKPVWCRQENKKGVDNETQ